MKTVQENWSPNGKSSRGITPHTPSSPPEQDARAHKLEARPLKPETPAAKPNLAAKARRLESTLTEELRNGLRIGGSSNASGDRRVLLDKEIDGYRIVLIREQTQPETPINLSPREQEIARMIAKGFPNKAIAAVLEISCWTVGTHLRRIFAKLGVTCRAAMVRRLVELGLTKIWA